LSEDPNEAIKHYQIAVDGLVVLINGKGKEKAKADDEIEREERKRTAIRALVSMVEIYMSDLWYVPISFCCFTAVDTYTVSNQTPKNAVNPSFR
jgi:hypothetical protein